MPSPPIDELFDVLVIGGGPAGLSGATVLGRAVNRVAVFDTNAYRNAVSRGVHGFLTRDGILPRDLRRIAREQLEPYDVRLIDKAVLGVRREGPSGPFVATLDDGAQIRGRRVLLATGMQDRLPTLPGFDEIYGVSAHHCPFCDGWEWRDRAIAVYVPEMGAEYGLTLLAWSPDVVLLTDGELAPKGQAAEVFRANGGVVVTRRVSRLRSAGGMLSAVEFEDGSAMDRDTFFFHLGMDQSSPIPAQMGCRIDRDGFVIADEAGRTSVAGVYAAGDLTPGPQSAILAAAEASNAAAAIHQDIHHEVTARRAQPAKRRR